jgi:hypothetical protein
MYRPFIPLNDLLDRAGRARFPQLSWSVQGRSVIIHWEESSAPIPRFDIAFEDGLAGLVAIDESTYASTRGYGLPGPDEFDATDFEASPRAALYGDLGSLVYRKVDSYFLQGGDVVLLIDVSGLRSAHFSGLMPTHRDEASGLGALSTAHAFCMCRCGKGFGRRRGRRWVKEGNDGSTWWWGLGVAVGLRSALGAERPELAVGRWGR